jgi:hypothetical protein
MKENSTLNSLEIKSVEKIDFTILSKFDVINVKILQKFYGKTIDPFSSEINSYDVETLHELLKIEGLKINKETLRKRLENLVSLNFLEKIDTYPRIYTAVRDIEKIKLIQSKIALLRSIFEPKANEE